MMARIRIPLALTGLLVALVLVLNALGAPMASAQPVSKASSETPMSSASSTPVVLSRVTGLPAIKATLPGHIPGFTAADVRAYIHKYPFEPGIDDSKITRLLFIPSSQASVLPRGAKTGIGDNEIVCYVEFDNINVTLYDVPILSGAAAPVIHTGHIVYDASDGNLLLYGGY